ncbi:RDD family protein [uncultured Tessaracoccus sp.]|uniref:RDD family protein n=1 Tax=uncultured Tessaracoccus sp. TaxID=905023 RepID=UPI00261373BA|nr:RDD family protein [uncultured Tessaracoccus sp.]
MTQMPQQPPPGWYPDPAGGSGQRFWDGEAWSQATREQRAPTQEQPQAHPQGGGTPYVDPRLRAHSSGYGTQGAGYGVSAYSYGKQIPVQGGYALAGFWWRVLGFIIDSIIVGIVNGMLTAGLNTGMDSQLERYLVQLIESLADPTVPAPEIPMGLIQSLGTAALVTTIMWIAYRTILIGTMNATLGQKICGLRVAKLGDEQLASVGWKVALIRGGVGAIIYQIVGFLAQITVLFLDRKQTLPDLLSKTVVINTREAV